MRKTIFETLSLQYPMIEDDEFGGELYILNQHLCGALEMSSNALKLLARRHKERLARHPPITIGVKTTPDGVASRLFTFLNFNRQAFDIPKLQEGMQAWTLDGALDVAILCRTEKGWQVQQEARELLKQQARLIASKEAAEILEARYEFRFKELEEQYRRMQEEVRQLRSDRDHALPALNETASALGRGLNAQKRTRGLRELN